MVFHTAPPQPASNARWTWAPELAGGAEASQKGFGERIPAKVMLRSATLYSRQVIDLPHLASMNGHCGQLAILDGHYRGRDVPRSNTIAAREDAGDVGFEIRIHLDVAALER